MWRLPESNWGHTDFQSVALPTELKRRPFFVEGNIITFPKPVKKNIAPTRMKKRYFTFEPLFNILTTLLSRLAN